MPSCPSYAADAYYQQFEEPPKIDIYLDVPPYENIHLTDDSAILLGQHLTEWLGTLGELPDDLKALKKGLEKMLEENPNDTMKTPPSLVFYPMDEPPIAVTLTPELISVFYESFAQISHKDPAIKEIFYKLRSLACNQ